MCFFTRGVFYGKLFRSKKGGKMNNLLDVLNLSSWIPLSDNLGIESARVITDMCVICNYAQENNELLDGEYFYYTKKKFEETGGIIKKTFQSIIKELKDKQIIEIKKFGLPFKNYYKIRKDVLSNFIKESKGGKND